MSRLIFLGPGSAFATQTYNACFALQQGDEYFLVDAGGGNGIIDQCKKAQIPLTSIRNMFITHNHSDHVLGAIWIVRFIGLQIDKGLYKGNFTLYGHQEVIDFIRYACRQTLPLKFTKQFDQRILFQVVEDGKKFTIQDSLFTFFDIYSTKLKQFGLKVILPNGLSFVCLGDEPYHSKTEEYVLNSDYLLCEAFCLDRDKKIYKPHEKHHGTALEGAKTAQLLGVSNLIFYHTEEDTLSTRKQTYSAEAKQVFSGQVYVPNDLDIIEIE